jgi:UMF1 family MFS transporter
MAEADLTRDDRAGTTQDGAPARVYPPRSAVIGWIFFDWAAQPYFSLITTFVFAPYFAIHVAASPASGQAMWGFARRRCGSAAPATRASSCRC